MKISIITPVHLWKPERVEAFLKTIESVRNQAEKNFEWIVVNDGSTEDFLWDSIRDIATVIDKDHEERVIAYNTAFKKARGDIFCLLDADDEYAPTYTKKVANYFKRWPEYKMFNFGCRYHHSDGKKVSRGSFKPKMLKVGHEEFGGGNIVNGTYVWHRSVYEDLGAFPPRVIKDINCTEINYGPKQPRDLNMNTPYDFSAAAQMEFPELRKNFMVNHEEEPNKIIKELGNPWGQDFYLFYKYTRKYHSKPLESILYIVHPK